LCASAALADGERLEKLTKEYEVVRRRHPSSSTDLRVYRCLGRFYADNASWETAEYAYRHALAAARNLYEEFDDPSALEHFWRVQAKMLAEAKTCLRKQGKLKEAEDLDAVLPPPSELRRQREETRWRRDRGYRSWAVRLALLNGACAAG